VTTNVVVDVDESAGTAEATAYVTIFQALPDFPLQPIFSGRYQDRFTRIDGSWWWSPACGGWRPLRRHLPAREIRAAGVRVNSLVPGGTGFVGRRLVEVLVAEGNLVTVLNRGVTPVELPPGVDRLVADRSGPASMRSALATSDWDAVFDVSGVVKVDLLADAGDLADLLAGLGYEAEVAAHVRKCAPRKDA
jgi:hypothetical protein